jgi:phospholipid/cholesterol/gamma-HCH transport system substrate-binding protein
VSGLYVDAPVKYRGVEVGKVREIALNPDNPQQVRLTLDIETTVPIKTDTIAVLTIQGLTGIAFIDLTGGSPDAPPLKAAADQRYPVLKTKPSLFVRLDRAGSELLANLNTLALQVSDVLDTENRRALTAPIANISKITTTLAGRAAELDSGVANASRLLLNTADASERLPALMEKIGSSVAAVEAMARKMALASEAVDETIRSSGGDLRQFTRQSLPEMGLLIGELRRLADTLQRVAHKLEEDPRVLFYGRDLEKPGPGE